MLLQCVHGPTRMMSSSAEQSISCKCTLRLLLRAICTAYSFYRTFVLFQHVLSCSPPGCLLRSDSLGVDPFSLPAADLLQQTQALTQVAEVQARYIALRVLNKAASLALCMCDASRPAANLVRTQFDLDPQLCAPVAPPLVFSPAQALLHHLKGKIFTRVKRVRSYCVCARIVTSRRSVH
jgi:hypothetical protein